MASHGPDFRLWPPGRVVFRDQDGVTIVCPTCKKIGAAITYLPGHVIHVAGWEPVPGRETLSQLTVIQSCPGVKKPGQT